MNPRALFAASFLLLTIAASAQQADDLKALNGDWIYVEDRTEGRELEQMGPPMSSKFSMRAEDGAVILVSGHGSGQSNVKVALDGTATEVPDAKAGSSVRYKGSWKDGAFTCEISFIRAQGQAPDGNSIKREFRVTADGLVLRAWYGAGPTPSIALYRHPEDIEMPKPIPALIGDLSWLSGAWVGTRGTNGTTSIEERWSPAKGGAMLATSRTVSREKMVAFEFLRIVERDGGLVYIAQPTGAAPTEFILTELSASRAVFDNPRHDYPKRIVYELGAGGNSLTATIGFMKGGTPRRFEFTSRER